MAFRKSKMARQAGFPHKRTLNYLNAVINSPRRTANGSGYDLLVDIVHNASNASLFSVRVFYMHFRIIVAQFSVWLRQLQLRMHFRSYIYRHRNPIQSEAGYGSA